MAFRRAACNEIKAFYLREAAFAGSTRTPSGAQASFWFAFQDSQGIDADLQALRASRPGLEAYVLLEKRGVRVLLVQLIMKGRSCL